MKTYNTKPANAQTKNNTTDDIVYSAKKVWKAQGELLSKAGVWAMYGRSGNDLYLLEVGETTNIHEELQFNLRVICDGYKHPATFSKKRKYRKFREWSEEFEGYYKRRIQKYIDIRKKYDEINIKILLYSNDRDERLRTEAEFAYMNKAKYWYPVDSQWKMVKDLESNAKY